MSSTQRLRARKLDENTHVPLKTVSNVIEKISKYLIKWERDIFIELVSSCQLKFAFTRMLLRKTTSCTIKVTERLCSSPELKLTPIYSSDKWEPETVSAVKDDKTESTELRNNSEKSNNWVPKKKPLNKNNRGILIENRWNTVCGCDLRTLNAQSSLDRAPEPDFRCHVNGLAGRLEFSRQTFSPKDVYSAYSEQTIFCSR